MVITIESLWYIYAFTFLLLGLIFFVISNRSESSSNAAASIFFASVLAALLVVVLAKIYIDPLTLLPEQKKSLDALYWISWGLALIFLFWYIFSVMGVSKKDVVEKQVTVECNESGDCQIVKVEDVPKPSGIISFSQNSQKPYVSPVGRLQMKYLV